MKEMIEFLNQNPTGSLATVNTNGEPRVRPFQFMLEQDGKLYFCTANTKNVYRQMKSNPSFEFTVTSPAMVTLRVRGKAQFEENLPIKEKILESNDLVRSIYQKADNPIFEIFFINCGEAVLSDFSGQPPRSILF